MTILITGATGLVGSRLVPRLVQLGFDLRLLVRDGRPGPAGTQAVSGDILDAGSLMRAVDGVSDIVHLAGMLRTDDPQRIWDVNLTGTRHLIEAAQAHAPSARLIMASTGLVYNADSPGPAREDDAVAPKRDYPASKVAAEKLLQDSGLNWSILRLGFVYGDGDGHVDQVPHIARLLGLHPANRLSMIHHADIATIVRMVIGGAADGQIVNVVDDAPASILELTQMAAQRMEAASTSLINPWSGILDGRRARTLGFRPEIRTIYQAIEQGLL